MENGWTDGLVLANRCIIRGIKHFRTCRCGYYDVIVDYFPITAPLQVLVGALVHSILIDLSSLHIIHCICHNTI